ncbi:alpha/beta hydrolase fold domain-containing protein [Microbacterium aurum]|uniref:alpha/beta hydrolase n=1 Tax=Microbacterium aurum TaxID=36805 RepID=UPI0028EE6BC2|nr:alpha/beta family hydrolase [Microbacterium aurum]
MTAERVRVYPAARPNGSGLVWAHGGGFAAGDLDMPEADHVARTLAEAGTTVVSVDYRLAVGGVRFPVPLEDVVTAWHDTWQRRAEFGIRRLAIGGASAGGNLAAAAALQLAGGDAAPALVVLAYPTLLAIQPAPDAALRAALDAQPAADRFGPGVVRTMYENYLGAPAESAPAAAAPGVATAAELADYPPTLIVNAEVDELRVSAEVFAAALRAAGRPVELVTRAGTDHGFLNRPAECADAVAETLALFAARIAGPARS